MMTVMMLMMCCAEIAISWTSTDT